LVDRCARAVPVSGVVLFMVLALGALAASSAFGFYNGSGRSNYYGYWGGWGGHSWTPPPAEAETAPSESSESNPPPAEAEPPPAESKPEPEPAPTPEPEPEPSPPAKTQPESPSLPGVSPCEALFDATNLPPACWRPYSDASPFNTPIPATEQAASDSQAIVERWMSFWADDHSYSPGFGVGYADTSEDYDHPIYFSKPTDPTYTVHCTESASWGPCAIEGAKVHIPSGARPAGGSDGHMAVLEQSSGWEYDFWQVQSIPPGGGTITASYGGKTSIGPGSEGLGSAATAAGFGLAAGIIRPDELAAGKINHALLMVVKCTNGTSVWPAGSGSGRSCSSMGLSNTDAPAMGQHFYLDLSEAQIEALPQPAWAKTILRAMSEYGLYVGDTGGGFLKLESGTSFTSLGLPEPWTQIAEEAGVPGTRDPATGKTDYQFDLSNVVNWAEDLKVAAG
jgi:hypothetical protein